MKPLPSSLHSQQGDRYEHPHLSDEIIESSYTKQPFHIPETIYQSHVYSGFIALITMTQETPFRCGFSELFVSVL